MLTKNRSEAILRMFHSRVEINAMCEDTAVAKAAEIEEYIYSDLVEADAKPLRVRKMRWGVEVYD